MELIEEILQTNEKFCANPLKNYEGEDNHESKLPKKKVGDCNLYGYALG